MLSACTKSTQILVALSLLALCSCRARPAACPPSFGACPPGATAGMQGDAMLACPYPPGMELGIPRPYNPCAAWKPDGLPCPWPEDEYICDGGDAGLPVGVGRDWEVHGLETEDTVVHYDALDGRTIVEPSNRVCVYAPRFGAVRQVVSLVSNEHLDHAVGAHLPVKPTLHDERQPVLASKQQIQPVGEIAARPPIAMLGRQYSGETSMAIKARAFQDAFQPYEDIAVIRTGVMEASQAAMLAQRAEAAVTWISKQAVQIIDDVEGVVELVRDEQAQDIFTYHGGGWPRLRVIKVASTPFAEPGDTIDFTIRFDNTGTEKIGNVTILDSLSPRLELVDGSAQCSREAKFFAEPNKAGSVVLRCELAEPLKSGEGGIIRFTCKVR